MWGTRHKHKGILKGIQTIGFTCALSGLKADAISRPVILRVGCLSPAVLRLEPLCYFLSPPAPCIMDVMMTVLDGVGARPQAPLSSSPHSECTGSICTPNWVHPAAACGSGTSFRGTEVSIIIRAQSVLSSVRGERAVEHT